MSDIVSQLQTCRIEDGRPLNKKELLGILYLLFLAGLDTVSSMLGWSFTHLAQHPEDRKRISAEPSLIPGAVEELKLRARGDLLVGGGDLAAAFMSQDLIDEYRIYVHPILIGEGKRLFPPSQEKVLLRLAETRAFGNGVVLLRYERLRPRGES